MSDQLDVKGAIGFFGGPAALRRRLTNAGTPVTLKAMEKWLKRGIIPGIWIVRLSQLARSEGRIFEITDFTKGSTQ